MVTIFVHGTLLPKPIINIPAVKHFFSSPKGLNNISNIGHKYHVKEIAEILSKKSSMFSDSHFYSFGWSGKLSVKAREKAAKELYDEIKKLYKNNPELKNEELCIITHSHGGNVALNLAQVAKEIGDTNFKVDKLILLGCPVQKEPSKQINSPIFSKIMSLHSHKDVAQILDPQGIYSFLKSLKHKGLTFTLKEMGELGPLFSKRHFPHSPNLVQAQIKINNKTLFHIEFLFEKFIKKLPKIIETISQYRKHKNIAPNKELVINL